jgi:hypothetical protein
MAKKKQRQKGLNIKGALDYHNRAKGEFLSMRKLGLLLGSPTAEAAAQRMNRLQHEKLDATTFEEVHAICRITGVDANYLFGITPLEINKNALTENL